MKQPLETLCITAVGIALAWAAPSAKADNVTLDAAITSNETLTDAGFLYTSNASPASLLTVTTPLEENFIPLGTLTANTAANISFGAIDSGNRAVLPVYGDDVRYVVLGENAGGGLSFVSNAGFSFKTFTTLFSPLTQSQILGALADPADPGSATIFSDFFTQNSTNYSFVPIYDIGSGTTTSNTSLYDFNPDNSGTTQLGNSVTATIVGPTDLPLPSPSSMGLLGMITLGLLHRRRSIASFFSKT